MGFSWKRVFNMVAFFALCFIGVAILLGAVIKADKVASAFQTIALVLAVVVVIFYAGIYAFSKSRKSNSFIIHVIIWAVVTALAIVGIILGLVNL